VLGQSSLKFSAVQCANEAENQEEWKKKKKNRNNILTGRLRKLPCEQVMIELLRGQQCHKAH